MSPNWISKTSTLRDKLTEEIAAIEEQRRSFRWTPETPINTNTVTEPAWQPTNQWQPQQVEPTQPVQVTVQPQVQTRRTQPVVSPTVQTTTPTSVPSAVKPTTTTPTADYTRELNPTHPFQIEGNALWQKVLNVAFKPFELIQEYVFDPLLGAIQGGWAQKTLTPQELTKAKSEGIASFFPGGTRHKAYEQLQYTGKWVVEMLPWLIVPPVGMVGKVGGAGKGIAGALGRLGKTGEMMGRIVEYSPAGLAEKATGAVVGGITSKLTKKAMTPIVAVKTGNVFNDEIINAVNKAKSEIPIQKALNRTQKIEQMTAVAEAAKSGKLIDMFTAAKVKGERLEVQGIRDLLKPETIVALEKKVADYGMTEPGTALSAGSFVRTMLDGGEMPSPSRIKAAAKILGEDVANSLIKSKDDSLFYKSIDTLNMFRATLASGDLSIWRQGMPLALRNPKNVPGVTMRAFKSLFSDKIAETYDEAIRSRPLTSIIDDLVGEKGYRFELTPLPSQYSKLPLLAREESAASKFIYDVPGLGSVVKASNRGFINGLNDMRSQALENVGNHWMALEKAGKVTLTENDWSELSKLIMTMSGRGELPKFLKGSSPVLNATLFSPRLTAAQMTFPTFAAMTSSNLVRKEAARSLAQFMGAGAGIVALAGMAGGKIEWNPKSSDFGKIKVGDTRLDIWGGYSQWARMLAQLVTAERKTTGGNIVPVNRAEVVERFLQSKLAPGTGFVYDLLRGETYMGEELGTDTESLQKQAWNRLVPLFAQDLIDAIDQQGVSGLVAVPGFFGVGVTTYLSPANKLREQLAKQNYQTTWEKLDGNTKLELERSSPKLLAEIEKERALYEKTITGKADVSNIYYNELNTIEGYYKSQIQNATMEYRDGGDGTVFREKIDEIASNRRSQYEMINQNPQFAGITAKYDEVPTAADLKKMSPQDWAIRLYNQMLYGKDMYDKYQNYRFDMVDEMKQQFITYFGDKGQFMLDYVEQRQGIKDAELPAEYQELKLARKTLKPYWSVEEEVIKMYGTPYSKYQQKRIDSLISKVRSRMKLSNPQMAYYLKKFYGYT